MNNIDKLRRIIEACEELASAIEDCDDGSLLSRAAGQTAEIASIRRFYGRMLSNAEQQSAARWSETMRRPA